MFLALASKLIHISGAVRPEDLLIFENKIKGFYLEKCTQLSQKHRSVRFMEMGLISYLTLC